MYQFDKGALIVGCDYFPNGQPAKSSESITDSIKEIDGVMYEGNLNKNRF